MLALLSTMPLRLTHRPTAILLGMMMMVHRVGAYSSCVTSSARVIPLRTSGGRGSWPLAVLAGGEVRDQQYHFLSDLQRIHKGTVVEDQNSFPYKRDDWLRNLLSIPRSTVLRRISGHIVFNIAVAALFCAVRSLGLLKATFPAVLHSLAGAFLGLLVTFRTNSAYARFWEARILWGGVMNTCRNLAIGISVWIKPRKPFTAQRALAQLHSYPYAVGKQCRQEVFCAGERPADVCQQLQTSLHESALASSWDGPMTLYELQIAEQARHVDKLVDATGALQRIISTPLPLAYGRHTSRFLTLWCGTLPLAIGSSVGLVTTLIAVAAVSWLVLGIDSIGQLLEHPFTQPKDNGDSYDFGLPVEVLARNVAQEVSRIGGL